MRRNVVTKTSEKIAFVSVFSVLTAVSAFIAIPLFPIPFTLQTVFVLLSGSIAGLRGSRLSGPLSQLLYILVGLLGMPVFAGGKGGPGIILSPTFGYLLMFPVASFIASFAAKRIWQVLLLYSTAIGIIYIGGAVYLHFYMSYILGKTLTFKALMMTGVLPFVPFDGIKIMIALPVHLRLSKMFSKEQ